MQLGIPAPKLIVQLHDDDDDDDNEDIDIDMDDGSSVK
jgi:hypothetical protein